VGGETRRRGGLVMMFFLGLLATVLLAMLFDD
jgi:hypothetical protein